MKEIDIEKLCKKNHELLLLLSFATTLLCEIEKGKVDKEALKRFKKSIENVVYKDIPFEIYVRDKNK